MPLLQPTATDVHINKPLTNILIGYQNMEFVADQIFPIVPVSKQTDIIPAINQHFFFRNDAGVVADGTLAPEVGYAVTATDTYYCLDVGARHFISDKRRANEDDPFDSDREASTLLMNKMLLYRELNFQSNFMAASVWSTDITGGSTVTKWSDLGASDPIKDIRSYKRTVRRLIGADPNVLVMGDLVFDRLQDHPDFLDRIKYGANPTRPADVTKEAIAALFGIEKILVGKAIYTSTNEGQTATYSPIWDDDALLCFVPPSPSIMVPAAGYTFVWSFAGEGGGRGIQWVRKWRDDALLGDWIEVRSCFTQKKTVAAAGAFFSDIVD